MTLQGFREMRSSSQRSVHPQHSHQVPLDLVLLQRCFFRDSCTSTRYVIMYPHLLIEPNTGQPLLLSDTSIFNGAPNPSFVPEQQVSNIEKVKLLCSTALPNLKHEKPRDFFDSLQSINSELASLCYLAVNRS